MTTFYGQGLPYRSHKPYGKKIIIYKLYIPYVNKFTNEEQIHFLFQEIGNIKCIFFHKQHGQSALWSKQACIELQCWYDTFLAMEIYESLLCNKDYILRISDTGPQFNNKYYWTIRQYTKKSIISPLPPSNSISIPLSNLISKSLLKKQNKKQISTATPTSIIKSYKEIDVVSDISEEEQEEAKEEQSEGNEINEITNQFDSMTITNDSSSPLTFEKMQMEEKRQEQQEYITQLNEIEKRLNELYEQLKDSFILFPSLPSLKESSSSPSPSPCPSPSYSRSRSRCRSHPRPRPFKEKKRKSKIDPQWEEKLGWIPDLLEEEEEEIDSFGLTFKDVTDILGDDHLIPSISYATMLTHTSTFKK